MARVITFSRQFPAYHPKAGQLTFFVEKLLRSFCKDDDLSGSTENEYFEYYCELAEDLNLTGLPDITPKYHTIRAGNRWKAGDTFSPRVWSGKPYNTTQITIAPDIKIVKTWEFEIVPAAWFDESKFLINGVQITDSKVLKELSLNDGLSPQDFAGWFSGGKMMDSNRKAFQGQVICWNPDINY